MVALRAGAEVWKSILTDRKSAAAKVEEGRPGGLLTRCRECLSMECGRNRAAIEKGKVRGLLAHWWDLWMYKIRKVNAERFSGK